MAKPYFHAKSSAKKYGGIWEDYMEIHEFMDSSKAAFPDNRHRCLTHNSWFIGTILPKVFGETFKRKSDDKIVNTRDIGEQHVLEDFKMKFIPSAQDFLQELEFLPWMQNAMGEPPSSHKKIHGNKNITKVKDEKQVLNEEERPHVVIPKENVEDKTISTGETSTNLFENIPEHLIVLDGRPRGNRPFGGHAVFD